MTAIRIKTNPSLSWVVGRNGVFDIQEIGLWTTGKGDTVYLDFYSAKRGVSLNAGGRLDLAAVDTLAREWSIQRGFTRELTLQECQHLDKIANGYPDMLVSDRDFLLDLVFDLAGRNSDALRAYHERVKEQGKILARIRRQAQDREAQLHLRDDNQSAAIEYHGQTLVIPFEEIDETTIEGVSKWLDMVSERSV